MISTLFSEEMIMRAHDNRIFEEGMEKGIEKGMELGLVEGIVKTSKRYKASIEDAIKNVTASSDFSKSEVYDASYFPYTNYARVGNSADDITGFGQQYNVLLIFNYLNNAFY